VHLISRSQGYHGTHGLGTSLGGIPANRVDVGPLDPNASQVPHDSLDALEAEIARVGADRVAAVFVEPVIGAGGVHQPRDGYLEGVDALCKRTGVLHVVDAVISGFGRLGEWFGPERWGLRPDMITFAKGVTSGYLPLGGVVISGEIAAPFWDEPNPPWFRHGPTYAGHPTCCAVALANLDIIEREGLLARGLELQDDLASALRPLESHALVGEVRAGIGALGAVALSGEALMREPKAPMRVWTHARDRGVLVRPLGDAVALSPPLIATRDDVETAATAIAEALDAVASELGVTAAA
jgi:adenosylmethionine-8-amino-7-oxononanoate aminotransferase